MCKKVWLFLFLGVFSLQRVQANGEENSCDEFMLHELFGSIHLTEDDTTYLKYIRGSLEYGINAAFHDQTLPEATGKIGYLKGLCEGIEIGTVDKEPQVQICARVLVQNALTVYKILDKRLYGNRRSR